MPRVHSPTRASGATGAKEPHGRAAPWPASAGVTRTQPLAPQVYRLVRDAIISAALPPKAAINEAEIALALGVSRTPVREALLNLQRDGLVEIRPQAGTFVTPIRRALVEEGMIVREALEVKCAALAAERITSRGLDALRAASAEMAAAARRGDQPGFIAADDGYHRTLLDAAGLPHVRSIIDGVNAHLDRVRFHSSGFADRAAEAIAEHEEVIAALTRRDAHASAAAVHAHLLRAWDNIRALCDEHGYV